MATRILFVHKENKNNDFIQQFFERGSCSAVYAGSEKIFGFQQKYLKLCSEDEQSLERHEGE